MIAFNALVLEAHIDGDEEAALDRLMRLLDLRLGKGWTSLEGLDDGGRVNG